MGYSPGPRCGHDFRDPAAYAGLGLAVLPLAPWSKRPHRKLAPHGVHDATRDPDLIRARLRADPQAGTGIACGAVSGLVIVDIDVKNGTDGRASWADFGQRTGLHWPAGPVVVTPSGGLHYWARWPGSYGPCPTRTAILPGVDIRGDGAYAAAPPSALALGERAAVSYIWHGCPCSMPWAPGWMPGWLAPDRGGGQDGPARDGGSDPPDLDAAKRDGLSRGSRDTECHRLACQGFGRYGPGGRAEVERDLRQVWQATADKADFGWDQVLKCIASAHRYISQSERDRESRRLDYVGLLR